MDPLKKVMEKWPNGYNFSPLRKSQNDLLGHCAWWVQQWTTCPLVGSTLGSKKKHLESYINQGFAFLRGKGKPKLHDAIITSESPTEGHLVSIAELDNVDNPKKARVAESNFAKPFTVTYTRWIDLNNPKIIGFIRANLKPQFKVEEVVKIIPEWGKAPVDKALKKGMIKKTDDLDAQVGNATAEAMFFNLGALKEKHGYLSKLRFIVAMDNLGQLN